MESKIFYSHGKSNGGLYFYLNPFLFKICILNTLNYFSFDLFVSAIRFNCGYSRKSINFCPVKCRLISVLFPKIFEQLEHSITAKGDFDRQF